MIVIIAVVVLYSIFARVRSIGLKRQAGRYASFLDLDTMIFL